MVTILPMHVQEVKCPLGHPMELVRFFTDDLVSAVQQTIHVWSSSKLQQCALFGLFCSHAERVQPLQQKTNHAQSLFSIDKCCWPVCIDAFFIAGDEAQSMWHCMQIAEDGEKIMWEWRPELKLGAKTTTAAAPNDATSKHQPRSGGHSQ